MFSRLKLSAALTLGILGFATTVQAQSADSAARPTIVLVHGAFADSSSWNGVIAKLLHDGYRVTAADNQLRSVHGDAAEVSAILNSINGPVVLVGHSYGGTVISEAAAGHANVKALVYVAAFMPAAGETSLGLSGKFPGSTLGGTLAPPVPIADGNQDLYISQDKFPAQFAADVPHDQAILMGATQRPVTLAALSEPSKAAAWQTIPAWSIYGAADLNIPAAAHAFMADRAHARRVVVVPKASHVVMVSHPTEVASLIEEAARAK